MKRTISCQFFPYFILFVWLEFDITGLIFLIDGLQHKKDRLAVSLEHLSVNKSKFKKDIENKTSIQFKEVRVFFCE